MPKKTQNCTACISDSLLPVIYCSLYLSVQTLEVFPELSDAVALADLNAEALLVCDVGGKAAEALAATASHPHQ